MVDRLSPIDRRLKPPQLARFEVALFACFGVSIDVFPGFSYSYSALAVLVLVLENTASSTTKSQNSETSKLARRVELLGTIALHWKTPLLAHGRSIVPNRSEPEGIAASKTNSRKTVRRRR
jgi:hypothetical protein